MSLNFASPALDPRLTTTVQAVPAVQTVQPPPSSSPAAAGEEQRWGLELSAAVERSVAIEPLERVERIYMSVTSKGV
jgi:hypothetical protein